jgi:hypothetical protein
MDEAIRLTYEGALDVARWVSTAYESGHFDWNLLCGGDEEECVAERWRMVRWLNDMKLLDEPMAGSECKNADDKEGAAACMLTFAFIGIREKALNFDMTPEDVMAA